MNHVRLFSSIQIKIINFSITALFILAPIATGCTAIKNSIEENTSCKTNSKLTDVNTYETTIITEKETTVSTESPALSTITMYTELLTTTNNITFLEETNKNEEKNITKNNIEDETITTIATETFVNNSNIVYYYVYEDKYDTCYYLQKDYQDYLRDLCEKYNVSEYYELFIALMYHESRFQEDIISETNDYGLMQINICNHEWLSKELGNDDFLDPYNNMEAGVLILSNFLNKYDDVHIALTCYALGESSYRKGIYTSKYSYGILADMEKLVVCN